MYLIEDDISSCNSFFCTDSIKKNKAPKRCFICGSARNRTWISGSGNLRNIHYTTEPESCKCRNKIEFNYHLKSSVAEIVLLKIPPYGNNFPVSKIISKSPLGKNTISL